jgi:hypothetical protein
MKRLVLVFLFADAAFPQPETGRNVYDWQVPQQVKKCVASFAPLAKSLLKINFDINPYYLRGDFDGDGRNDLAIAMLSANDNTKLGTGICRGGMPPVLLGSIGQGKPFSDDPADSIASVGWAVITRDQVIQILKTSNPSRHQKTRIRAKLAMVKGEMIYMPYEDAEGLIFFAGGHFQWYTINSTMFPQAAPP